MHTVGHNRWLRAVIASGGIVSGGVASAPLSALAQSAEDQAAILRGRIHMLEEDAAAREDALAAQLEAQEARIRELERQLQAVLAAQGTADSGGADRPEGQQAVQPAARTSPTPSPQAQEAPDTREARAPVQPVGQEPERVIEPPAVDLFAALGGVLTPRGTLYAETGLRYSASSDNRFFFSGLEIVDALLIGVIEARDTDRRTYSVSQGLRYGLTNRLEVEATVPFVAQDDRVANVAVASPADNIENREGYGLGDVTAGLHYQLNQGRRLPYVVANLRAKAPTGTGLFEIEDDEAPTGSGYWTVEPSLTFIQRSDPVVLFGNVGYQVNLATDIGLVTTQTDTDGFVTADRVVFSGQPTDADLDVLLERLRTTTSTEWLRFDPGDALRSSFGVGIAFNEAVNLNFGYDQSYVFASESEVVVSTVTTGATTGTVYRTGTPERTTREGQASTIGSFLFGLSYRPTDRLRLSVTTSVGATDEAPDANVSLRSQLRF